MLAWRSLLVAALCASCGSDSDSPESLSAGCPFPDTYVVRPRELSGDCGALTPEVVMRRTAPLPDDGCTRTQEKARCFVTLDTVCKPDAAGLALSSEVWVDGEGGRWRGEMYVYIQKNGERFCSSNYAIELEPR